MSALTLIALTFAGTTAGAAILAIASRRARERHHLRQRLGRLGGGDADLVRENSQAGFLVGTESTWSFAGLLTRIACAAAIGVAVGVAVGSAMLSIIVTILIVTILWAVTRRASALYLRRCDEQMPQALEIVSLALRAGHALPSALAIAADEIPNPLSRELQRVVRENSLGRPQGEVITELAQRLRGCDAIESFVVAVLVLQETGGNLVAVIDQIIGAARARSSYRARLRALTAEGRQSAKLLAALPLVFALLVISVDPMYLETMATPGGKLITAAAFAMWIAGIAWTRHIVQPLT